MVRFELREAPLGNAFGQSPKNVIGIFLECVNADWSEFLDFSFLFPVSRLSFAGQESSGALA